MDHAALMSFLSIILVIHVAAFTCPDNFIQGSDGTCCEPKQCSENQGFKLCSNTDSPGHDECYDCPIGTRNPNPPINTAFIRFNIEVCTKLDCSCLPEAELQNREECEKTGRKVCVCKRWERYYGPDPGACKGPVNDEMKLQRIRQKGHELKITGEIDWCEKGFYKDRSDDAVCIPHKLCPDGYMTMFNGSATQDRECQKMTTTILLDTTTAQPVTTTAQPVTTTAQPVTTTAQPVTTTAQPVTTSPTVTVIVQPTNRMQNGLDSAGKEPKTEEENLILILIIVTMIIVVTVIVLVIIIVVLCICKRRRRKKSDDPAKDSEKIALSVNGPANDQKQDETTVIKETELLLVGMYNELKNGNEIDKNRYDENHTPLLSPDAINSDSVSVQKTDLAYPQLNGTLQNGGVPMKPAHSDAKLSTRREELEVQKSDPSNVRIMATPGTEPRDAGHDSLVHVLPLQSLSLPNHPQPPHLLGSLSLPNHPQPPQSLGSLQSSGKFEHLSLSSLDTDYRIRSVAESSTADSDYGTGSSRKDDDSLGMNSGFNSLHMSSLQESRERESGRNEENAPHKDEVKLVVRVAPFRRDEAKEIKLETVDEEQTHSKSP